MLFAEISKLIFRMIQSFYAESAGRKIQIASVIAYQSFGDMNRASPHYHGIIVEGGFDENSNFVYLPVSDTKNMTELFRRLVIKFFKDRKLTNDKFGRNLLAWKNSGFSIDNSIKISANDDKVKEAVAQYISRPPVSLKQLMYEQFRRKVLLHTRYN